jgi:hypothetical protein
MSSEAGSRLDGPCLFFRTVTRSGIRRPKPVVLHFRYNFVYFSLQEARYGEEIPLTWASN